MAVWGLRFCARAPSSCGKWGPLPIAMHGPPTIAAPPAAEHRLQTRRPSNCGSWAQPLRGMWDPPRPGPEPVSPALAGRFPTTAPPGKPQYILKALFYFIHSSLYLLIPYPFLALPRLCLSCYCLLPPFLCPVFHLVISLKSAFLLPDWGGTGHSHFLDAQVHCLPVHRHGKSGRQAACG